jgi:type II secretory pathway component GspD/PulD (secretin)
MKLRTAILVCLTVLALLACGIATAEWTDYSNPRIANGAAGPLPSAATSRIDDYTFQPDQVNIAPDDGELRVLRTNQKIDLNQFVPHLIPMTNMNVTQVRELRSIMRQICRMEGGNAQIARDVAGKGQEHFVEVTCPPFQLPFIEATLGVLDKPWITANIDGSGDLQWRAKYRDIRKVDIFPRAYTGGSSVIHLLDNTVTHLVVPSQLANYVTIANLADIPVSRIMLDTQMYEVSTNNDMKLGLDYIAWKNTIGQDLWDLGYASVENKVNGAEIADSTANFRTFGAVITSEFFDFLSVKGKAKVLASTTLQTVSGKLASYKSVDPVPAIMTTGHNLQDAPDQFFVDTDANPVAPGQNPFDKVGANWSRFVNFTRDDAKGQAGIFLNVLPVVGTDSAELFVGATISEVTGKTPMGLPTITENSVVSQVRVRDGEETLVAGLTRSEKVNQKAAVPWLGDIPIIGYVFGGTTKLDRDSCIVISMQSTCSIGYVNPADGRALTNEEVKALKDKQDFKGLTPKSLAISDVEKNIMDEAAQEKRLVVPETPFGFDQWFLDQNKMCPSCPPGSFTTVEAAAEFGPTDVAK